MSTLLAICLVAAGFALAVPARPDRLLARRVRLGGRRSWVEGLRELAAQGATRAKELWVGRRGAERRRAAVREACDVVVAELRAGHSPGHALEAAGAVLPELTQVATTRPNGWRRPGGAARGAAVRRRSRSVGWPSPGRWRLRVAPDWPEFSTASQADFERRRPFATRSPASSRPRGRARGSWPLCRSSDSPSGPASARIRSDSFSALRMAGCVWSPLPFSPPLDWPGSSGWLARLRTRRDRAGGGARRARRSGVARPIDRAGPTGPASSGGG